MTMAALLRHSCRRCRLKLDEPVENPRSAFCCRGCYRQHYEKHCVACEKPKTGRKLTHSNPSCRAEYRALVRHEMLGRYHTSGRVKLASETPIFTGSVRSKKAPRAWVQVAGPPMPPAHLHLAALGAPRAAQPATLIKRNGPPINLVGGYKFPVAPRIEAA